ncbi:MAG: DNA polymerase III subunit delta [Christensenellales bacterium]|jgi:DNA polymerase-3 subunit delta
MDYQAFLKRIEHSPQGIYLFYGEDAFLAQQALTAVRSKLDPALADMNEDVLHTPDVHQLIAACETLPAFDAFRLVVARDTRFLSLSAEDAQLRELCAYLARVPEHLCLILLEPGKPDARKAGYKALTKVLEPVAFSTMHEAGAAQFVVECVKKAGCEISFSDARVLVEAVGCETGRLYQECAKLCAGSGERIDAGLIERMVSKSIESNMFRMLDAFESGRLDDAFERLHALRMQNEPALLLLGALASRFRLVLQAAELAAAKRGFASMGTGYAAKKAIQAQKRYSVARLRSILRILLNADVDIKSGRRRDFDAIYDAVMEIYCDGGKKN